MVSLEYVVVCVPNPRECAQHRGYHKRIRDNTSCQNGVMLLCAMADDVDDLENEPP